MEPSFPNSAFVRTLERPLWKRGRWRMLDIPIRYGIFHHPRRGVVLIDTGYTDAVTRGQRSFLLRAYARMLGPRLVAEGQLRAVLAAQGLEPRDVRAVIVTHFHADHISGCRDLWNARFYAMGSAYEALCQIPPFAQARQGVFLQLLPDEFRHRLIPFEETPVMEGPLGLGSGYDIFGDGSVFVTPLPGHAIGHVGVAFPTLKIPLLYAVDAEWLKPALAAGQSGSAARLIGHSQPDIRRTNERVLAFERAGGRVVLCHDPGSLS